MKILIPILLVAASLSAQTIRVAGPFTGATAIAASRDRILATWVANQQLHGEVIDLAGNVVTGTFDLPSAQGAAIVTDGERFLVYWTDGGNVEGVFVPGDNAPFPIVSGVTRVAASFDGKRFLFFSQQGTTIRATPLGGASFDVMQNATLGGVASSPDGTSAVTWTQTLEKEWAAGISFVTGDQVLEPSLLATLDITSGFGQTYIIAPAVAWNGTDWYAVWHAGWSARQDRYEGKIVGRSGSAAIIDDDLYTGKAYGPSVLSIGSQFLVIWTRDSPASDSYVGRYVSSSGEPGARISLAYGTIGARGTTVALPDGTLVSIVSPLIGDTFIHFGRAPRRRVSRSADVSSARHPVRTRRPHSSYSIGSPAK